ncbi:MAG: hypothetical protein DCC68_25880 [Planctomycetota bacterium]|nr:MAG: hypothetical protein DCC68_25880 [Planctomycetota bacterium]
MRGAAEFGVGPMCREALSRCEPSPSEQSIAVAIGIRPRYFLRWAVCAVAGALPPVYSPAAK